MWYPSDTLEFSSFSETKTGTFTPSSLIDSNTSSREIEDKHKENNENCLLRDVVKMDVKNEPLDQEPPNSSKPTPQSTTSKAKNLSQLYEEISFKNYTSNFVQEDPVKDITAMYKESLLDFEKQKYHQQMLDKIVEDITQVNIEDLENQYIDHVRQAAKLEIFSCVVCEYQSMHKSNIRLHLVVIHKIDGESNMLKCLKCYYTCKLPTFMQRHVASQHQDEISDFEDVCKTFSSNDEEDFVNSGNKKRKKTRKSLSRCNFSATRKTTKLKKQGVKVWSCDLCSFDTRDKESFFTHKQTHRCLDNMKKFRCYKCEYECYDKGSMKKHLLKIHEIVTKDFSIKILKCEFCNYTTDLIESLRVHALSHKNPDEIEWFQCEICDFKTKFKSSYRIHLVRHKNPQDIVKSFMCEFCSFKCRFRGALQRHLLTHQPADENTEWFKCPDCDYKGRSRRHLSVHLISHKGPSEIKMYVCEICGLQNRRKWNYEMHMLTHKSLTDVDIFKCTFCNYESKFRHGLRRHLKLGSHSRGRRKRVSSKEGQSKNNVRSMEEVETFGCLHCNYRTKYKGSLKHHINIHKDPSEITMYKCDTCGIRVRRKENLNVHLLLHKSSDEVEMITCSLCSYQTKFKAYMRAHLKKRHKIITKKDEFKEYTTSAVPQKNPNDSVGSTSENVGIVTCTS